MKLTVKAPGKLVLFGEYAVLENAPALVAAVDRYCVVQVEVIDGNEFTIEAVNFNVPSFSFRLNDDMHIQYDVSTHSLPESLTFFTKVFEHIARGIQSRGAALPPSSIRIDTAQFYQSGSEKMGFGASAAMTTALTAALLKIPGLLPDSDEQVGQAIYPTGIQAHSFAQGRSGSGIDIAASSYGGVLQYVQPADDDPGTAELIPTSIPRGLSVIPIWSGKSASTADMIGNLEALKSRAPGQYETIMNELKSVSSDGCAAFLSGNTADFLQLVDTFFDLLYKLGRLMESDIISPAHTGIAALVRHAGGHYKPSGAGRGDVGLALTDSYEVAETIRDQIDSSSFEIANVTLGSPGLILQVSSN